MKRPMNHRRAVAAMLCAAFCGPFGCRHADLKREMVETEMRLQEDELYRAHDLIASRERLLESTRRENETLKREIQQARGGPAIPPDLVPRMPPAPTGEPPTRSPRPGSGVPPLDIQPPTIEIPGQQPPPRGAAPNRSPPKLSRGVTPASHEVASPRELDLSDEPHSRIDKVALNPRLTGGFDADHRLGDEGIMVVIEPRDQSDRIVRQSGKISVAVIDPALSGEAGRVARWDFSAEEAHRNFRADSALVEGIHLELRWPTRPPEHERLMVFVRLTTADGERHEASQSILVDLGDDVQAGDAQTGKARRTASAATGVGWSPDR